MYSPNNRQQPNADRDDQTIDITPTKGGELVRQPQSNLARFSDFELASMYWDKRGGGTVDEEWALTDLVKQGNRQELEQLFLSVTNNYSHTDNRSLTYSDQSQQHYQHHSSQDFTDNSSAIVWDDHSYSQTDIYHDEGDTWVDNSSQQVVYAPTYITVYEDHSQVHQHEDHSIVWVDNSSYDGSSYDHNEQAWNWDWDWQHGEGGGCGCSPGGEVHHHHSNGKGVDPWGLILAALCVIFIGVVAMGVGDFASSRSGAPTSVDRMTGVN